MTEPEWGGREGEIKGGEREYLKSTIWKTVFLYIHECFCMYKKKVLGNMKQEESMLTAVLKLERNIAY